MVNNYVLYSNGCPRCKILKKKLDDKGITYVENNSVDEMLELGFTSVPMLDVGGEVLDYGSAVKWINEK